MRHLAQQRLHLVQVPVPGMPLGERARRRAQRGVRRARRLVQRGAQRRQIVGTLHHQAATQAVQQLRRAHEPTRHHRHPGRAGLQHDVAERLLPRRDAEHVGSRQDGGHVVPAPQYPYAVRQAARRDVAPEPLQALVRAHHG
jgi:hypothetical protein